MDALSLFETLASSAPHSLRIKTLLQDAAPLIQTAFAQQDATLIKKQVATQQQYADRTTIYANRTTVRILKNS